MANESALPENAPVAAQRRAARMRNVHVHHQEGGANETAYGQSAYGGQAVCVHAVRQIVQIETASDGAHGRSA